MIPLNKAGYDLLHEGAVVLSQVEANGIRVDIPYMKKAVRKCSERVAYLQNKQRDTKVFSTMRKRYGQKLNPTSRQQIATVLFEDLGYKPPGRSAAGNWKFDGDVLETIDNDFVKMYAEAEKLRKLTGTYLKGTLEEVSPDGFLRCSYNLHLARTYRSSSSNPNLQNQPIRDPMQGKIIRRGFIPREGHRICEIDYSSIEVRVAAAYHKDPVMLKYLSDPESDMHGDVGRQLFFLDKSQKLPKEARHIAKNGFVFPAFYGDFYASTAKAIWNAVHKSNIRLESGVLLQDHMASKGITHRGACNPDRPAQPGSFEKHVQDIEKDFWERRFKVYNEWKRTWYDAYIKNGYFSGLSGFRWTGLCRKNVVINAPVQSAAFHCLLWSLIEVQKYLNKHKMKTVIVGQIHDSLIADVHEDEMDEYLCHAKRIMVDKMKEHFTWLEGIPIDVEAEACDTGQTWYDKKVVQIPSLEDLCPF